MKTNLLLSYVFLIVFTCDNLYSQEINDTLSVTNGIFHSYKLNNKRISSYEAFVLLRKNPGANAYLNKYAAQKTGGILMLTGGGIIIGLQMDKLISDKYSDYFPPRKNGSNDDEEFTILLAIGLGSVITGAILLNAQNRNLKKAISIYNQKNKTITSNSVTMHMGLVENGIGFQVDF